MSAVVAPTRPPEALASREESCPLCPDLIEKADPIKKCSDALGWAHAGCADDYFEVYPPDEGANKHDNDGAAVPDWS